MKEIRKKNRAISDDDAQSLLVKGEYGVLSTASKLGEPYGLPLNYCVLNNSIYFHVATEGHKMENIEENNLVSFCVVGKTEVLQNKFTTKYESVIAFGEIEESFNDEKQKALVELIHKYSPKFIKEGIDYINNSKDDPRVFKMEIKHITGKANR